MPKTRSTRPLPLNGVGHTALVVGIFAAVFAFVPIVGDLVSVPAALIAVACGWIGLARVDKGLATNHREALGGAVLGITALFVVFLVFVATHGTMA
ncbi:hypothetical protein [Rhodococcus chondri]|uniref:DUF4190 domain-containing protein n=1 Tax=Rhodococcus chondri TaxID=3065941 RepID=A0ABU7JRD4_9NOCA|nr:hypothetical protein [Rhodococcus sp. CC-R104]MEE2032598.1 hypothetical protein [Rhodococcus sp. CC-R104]